MDQPGYVKAIGIETMNHMRYVLRIVASAELFFETRPASRPPTTFATPIAPKIHAVRCGNPSSVA